MKLQLSESERDLEEVRDLYRQLLSSWNKRNAHEFANLFVEDGHVIGYDGSEYHGQAEIEMELGKIFTDHVTASYVSIVRDVRFLSPEAALLRAVVGMVPPGKTDLNPAVNAIQTLVATRQAGPWRIALFQNTPAQYHGRPELAQQLTEELRQHL